MIDAFAKRFTANVKLGEEFVSAIADTSIMPSDLCVRTRAALMAANLTSPTIVDGVARLHTRADVQSLKTKASEVKHLESGLELCATARGELRSAKALSRDDVLVLEGRSAVRSVTLLTNKEQPYVRRAVCEPRRHP